MKKAKEEMDEKETFCMVADSKSFVYGIWNCINVCSSTGNRNQTHLIYCLQEFL